VKAPKSSTTAAPLAGVGVVDGTPAPLPSSGSVTRQGDALVLGFTRYGLFCLVASTFEPASGTGAFVYDCNLDGVADETVGAEEVPCTEP
jgi:hypothetical protein